jgi:hypothetical protein
MYASFLRISRALHLDVFEQPEENYFFNNLLGGFPGRKPEMGCFRLAYAVRGE